MTDAPVKPRKLKRERFEVDGKVVELVQMEPDLRRAYHGAPEKATRSQWEIRVDGELRGYAIYPLGVGNPWEAYSLLPNSLRCWGGSWQYDHNNPNRTIRAWKNEPNGDLEGTWDGWSGRFYYLTPVGRDTTNSRSYNNKWKSREEIALAWPHMMEVGAARPAEEVEAAIKAANKFSAERKTREAQEKIENEARWAQERLEREQAAARAEEKRLETLEGLESIRERFGTQLSNLELVALGRAIERFQR